MDMNTSTYMYDITITSDPSGAAVYAKPVQSFQDGDFIYENMAYDIYGSLDDVLVGYTPFRAEIWCEATPTSPYGYVKTKWFTHKGNNTSEAIAMVGVRQCINTPGKMNSQSVKIFYLLKYPGYLTDMGEAGGPYCGTLKDTLHETSKRPYSRHHVLITNPRK